MSKEVLATRQGLSIIAMFVVGSSIVLGTGGEAKQDIWLAILLTMVMVCPILLVYIRLLTLFPGKDLYDILEFVFGKIIGKLIMVLFIWYTFHLGAIVIRNFSEFIQIVGMPETPQYIVVLAMGLLSIWVVRAGLEVLGRWATFVFPFFVILLIAVISLSLTEAQYSNLLPVLSQGWGPIFKSSFGLLTFPFGETVVFTIVFSNLEHNNKIGKVYFYSLLISGSLILAANVRNILVLGVTTTLNLYFPSYSAVSIINIGDILQRFEVLVAINFLFAGFVKISVCLYAASKGISKLFQVESYRSFVAPIGFLMMNLSLFIYKNVMEMFDWAFKIYKYYAIPFQIVLPLIILIAAEIKKRSMGKQQTS